MRDISEYVEDADLRKFYHNAAVGARITSKMREVLIRTLPIKQGYEIYRRGLFGKPRRIYGKI